MSKRQYERFLILLERSALSKHGAAIRSTLVNSHYSDYPDKSVLIVTIEIFKIPTTVMAWPWYAHKVPFEETHNE